MAPAALPPSAGLDIRGLQHIAGFLLTLADLHLRRTFQAHIGDALLLRPVEFTLLVLLRDNPGAAPKRLAQALGLPAPHLTLVLDRLVGRGLIERRRSPSDGRGLEVCLTPAGLALVRRAHRLSLTMEDQALQVLSPAERAMLCELLVKVTSG